MEAGSRGTHDKTSVYKGFLHTQQLSEEFWRGTPAWIRSKWSGSYITKKRSQCLLPMPSNT